MSNEQEMREAFERWFKDYSDAYDIEVGSRNYYAVMKAWNAATLAAEARIRELEGEPSGRFTYREYNGSIVDGDTGKAWFTPDAAIEYARDLEITSIRAKRAALTEHKENQG